jgi:hypothetical protein
MALLLHQPSQKCCLPIFFALSCKMCQSINQFLKQTAIIGSYALLHFYKATATLLKSGAYVSKCRNKYEHAISHQSIQKIPPIARSKQVLHNCGQRSILPAFCHLSDFLTNLFAPVRSLGHLCKTAVQK